MFVCNIISSIAVSDTWASWSLTWLSRHLDAPPPQPQRAVQVEHDVRVVFLIEAAPQKVLSEPRHIGGPIGGGAAVLEPVLGSHSRGEVDRGQQAQNRTDY